MRALQELLEPAVAPPQPPAEEVVPPPEAFIFPGALTSAAPLRENITHINFKEELQPLCDQIRYYQQDDLYFQAVRKNEYSVPHKERAAKTRQTNIIKEVYGRVQIWEANPTTTTPLLGGFEHKDLLTPSQTLDVITAAIIRGLSSKMALFNPHNNTVKVQCTTLRQKANLMVRSETPDQLG
jgi:hypothetical protein